MNLTSGLGHVPKVARSFTGLQHRERELTQLLSVHSLDPRLAMSYTCQNSGSLQETSWNALQLFGNEADFKSAEKAEEH